MGVRTQEQRVVEERSDHLRGNGGQGGLAQSLGTNPRRQTHRRRRCAGVDGQEGAVAHAREHQHLTGKNQVWVANLLEVHAPQFGPAPGLAQKQGRDVPQRVAAAHGVALGRIGRQRRQRHPGLGHLLRGVALGRADGQVGKSLRACPRTGQQQGKRGHGPAAVDGAM